MGFFLLEDKWQQVSSSLQHPSKYSCWSEKFSGLDFFSEFPLLRSFFSTVPKNKTMNCIAVLLLLLLLLLLLFTPLRVFHTSVSWWFSSGVWVIASLLKSSELFLVFWIYFNHTVVWMVSARPLISKSSIPSTSSLGTVPSAPITISITVTLMFHSFFCSLARS